MHCQPSSSSTASSPIMVTVVPDSEHGTEDADVENGDGIAVGCSKTFSGTTSCRSEEVKLRTEDVHADVEKRGSKTPPYSRGTTLQRYKSLKLTSPEILRGTLAATPLWRIGAVLRTSLGGAVARGQSDDCYEQSFVVDELDEFWSHSWHGPAWHKIATLLVYYNGGAAAAASLLAAGLGLVLQVWLQLNSRRLCSLMTMLPGALAFFAALLSWQSGRRVFVDKLCISQADPDLKLKGIKSIGGFLRHSRGVLILWDATYARRLWCAFELAAACYLQKRIFVRPSFQGALTVCVFGFTTLQLAILYTVTFIANDDGNPEQEVWVPWASCTVVLLAPFFKWLREQYRDIREQAMQLDRLSIREVECFCCKHGHRHPDTGDAICCDRVIVESSVCTWFGSLDIFDQFVHDKVRLHILHHLAVMPYHAIILMTWPIFLAKIGNIFCAVRTCRPSYKFIGFFVSEATPAPWMQVAGAVFSTFVEYPLAARCAEKIVNKFACTPGGWKADWCITIVCASLALIAVGCVVVPGSILMEIEGYGPYVYFAFEFALAVCTGVAFRHDLATITTRADC